MEKPPIHLYLTEIFRSFAERISSMYYRSTYKPERLGDRRPILVIPGIITSDSSTKALRSFLDKLGYTSYPWGLGVNMGEYDKHLPALENTIAKINEKHGNQVTLIGWSLGGIYARELGKSCPSQIKEIITLGSPFSGIEVPNRATWLFNLMLKVRKQPPPDPSWIRTIHEPAPVKTTAIYSRQDGIVPWEACKEKHCDLTHRNIEVRGSHTGLGYNKDVFVLVEKILDKQNDNFVAKETEKINVH